MLGKKWLVLPVWCDSSSRSNYHIRIGQGEECVVSKSDLSVPRFKGVHGCEGGPLSRQKSGTRRVNISCDSNKWQRRQVEPPMSPERRLGVEELLVNGWRMASQDETKKPPNERGDAEPVTASLSSGPAAGRTRDDGQRWRSFATRLRLAVISRPSLSRRGEFDGGVASVASLSKRCSALLVDGEKPPFA